MLPNLIIAGVTKAGTTSLFSYLAAHPDVCGSDVKETQHFRPLLYDGPVAELEEYLGHFAHCGNQRFILEATPEYFYGGKRLARELKSVLTDVKIIVIFREPISRLISFYRFKKSHMELNQNVSLEKYIKACEAVPLDEFLARHNSVYMGIQGGFYDQYLPDWFEVFGDSLRIAFFEDLRADRSQYLRGIAEWLEIRYDDFKLDELDIVNRTVNYKSSAFQKLALILADKGESFWRSRPSAYGLLKNIYYFVNGKSFDETPSQRTLSYLERIFRPHNKRLRKQLEEIAYNKLPAWLMR